MIRCRRVAVFLWCIYFRLAVLHLDLIQGLLVPEHIADCFESLTLEIMVHYWLLLLLLASVSAQRSFRVDYAGGTFLKDGKPFQYVSGSMHYFRIPHQHWPDRLMKARQGGLNAIQTYVEWSSHQPEPDVFDFTANLNLTRYLEEAQKAGLYVIIRLGPFIASERDNMGLPYWLATKNPKIRYRTSDKTYLKYVVDWYHVLLPKLVPYLYQNGGPIIMAQVENEYGSYADYDSVYISFLRDLFRRYLGPDFQLFTVDGPGQLPRDIVDGVFPTLDFGASTNRTDVELKFALQRKYANGGPPVNTEFYTAFYDVWGRPHNSIGGKHKISDVATSLDIMLSMNASVNFYMYHGGTSFGFMNGALTVSNYYSAMVTSYDFNAPISDVGELTEGYFLYRKVIRKYFPDVPPVTGPKPSRTPAQAITLQMGRLTDIFRLMNQSAEIIKPVRSIYPMPFEQLKLRHAFVYYEHIIDFKPSDPILLAVQSQALHDRALVFTNEQYRGTLYRNSDMTLIPLSGLQRGDRLGLFVENQGHTCCNPNLPELKGILANVTLGIRKLTHWVQYPMFYNWSTAFDTLSRMPPPDHGDVDQEECGCQKRTFDFVPTFYVATFQLAGPAQDLYLDVGQCGRKGVALLNGMNLGRYWPVMGPQLTLYAPSGAFKSNDTNILILFELESPQRDCLTVTLGTRHILNGTVPDDLPPPFLPEKN